MENLWRIALGVCYWWGCNHHGFQIKKFDSRDLCNCEKYMCWNFCNAVGLGCVVSLDVVDSLYNVGFCFRIMI